jgi:hypothetical protein
VPGLPDQRPLSADGVSVRKREPPRAFHGLDELDHGPNRIAGHHHRGACQSLAALHTRAPLLLRRTIDDLVQVSGLLRRSTSSPRWASRLASNPSPRCLEHRFYNRRFASRAPAEHPLRRPSAGEPWETRRSFDFVDRPRIQAFPPTEHDAGPPRGHPASDSLALDGAVPASGESSFRPCWHGEGESVAAFSAGDSSVDSNPLTPLAAPGHRVAEAALFPDAWARSHRGTSMRPAFQSPRCLPPEKTARASFESSRGALPRWPASTAAARVHRRSRTID